jgi:hypothetical protein
LPPSDLLHLGPVGAPLLVHEPNLLTRSHPQYPAEMMMFFFVKQGIRRMQVLLLDEKMVRSQSAL